MKKLALAAVVLGASLAMTGCFDKEKTAEKVEQAQTSVTDAAKEVKDAAMDKAAEVKDAAVQKAEEVKQVAEQKCLG